MSTRTDRNQTFDSTGAMTSEQVVVVDTTADTNAASIRDLAAAALAANRTFIALPTPTNTQVVAQTKALTRQMNALIRLALGRLDGTD
jgi:hypothetical protein